MKNFKKIMSLILVVVFVFVMSTVAFAAPGSGTPIGSTYEQSEFVTNEMEYTLSAETAKWEYDSTYRYIDENGNVWRWCKSEFARDPNLGHNYRIDKSNEQWLYDILDDGTLCISSSPDVELDLNIVAPSTLDGKTVTRISSAGNTSTLSIIIPDTITRIDYRSFESRSSLKRVYVPVSVKSIEVHAFELCSDNGIEIYYEGTEKQWNDIVVWSPSNTIDPVDWAVTDFNWTAEYAYGDPSLPTGTFSTDVKTVHFNVDPSTLEDLVPEEEDPQQSVFDQIFAPVKQFFASVISFFKMVVSWFNFGK